MFNFIDIYSFIPVSDCVAMSPNALRHNRHCTRKWYDFSRPLHCCILMHQPFVRLSKLAWWQQIQNLRLLED